MIRLRLVAAAVVLALLPTGCGFSVYDLPLPGGAKSGPDAYHVTVEFRDVLDLVPRSSVKVNDVSVGEVEKVWLDGFTAKVRLRVARSARLPDNATAQIRQTSLLGEKFVSLSAPPSGGPAYGRLSEGDVIPLSRTGRNVEVEEVLSALSLLLNGGGVAQLKTINTELNNALEGRESSVREVLRQLDAFVGELDAHQREINRAIDNLDRLAASLAEQEETIATAVDEIPAALTVLVDQRRNLTRMLVELSELGTVGTRVIEASKDDLLANLRALDPVLTELAKSGDNLPKALEVLFTYPFADSAARAPRGDYTNLQVTLDLDLRELLAGQGLPPSPSVPPSTSDPKLPLPKLPVPTSLPTELPKLPLPGSSGPTPSPGSSSPPPVLCLPPLTCASGAAATSWSAGYDPELAALLLGEVA